MTNNISEVDIENIHFVDESEYNYSITDFSPAVNAGIIVDPVEGHSLTPEYAYVHPTDSKERVIVLDIDAGAIEGDVLHSAFDRAQESKVLVFPNPFADQITIEKTELETSEISIFTMTGTDVSDLILKHQTNEEIILDTSNLPKGAYILKTSSNATMISKF